jgi:hypothetical protein
VLGPQDGRALAPREVTRIAVVAQADRGDLLV